MPARPHSGGLAEESPASFLKRDSKDRHRLGVKTFSAIERGLIGKAIRKPPDSFELDPCLARDKSYSKPRTKSIIKPDPNLFPSGGVVRVMERLRHPYNEKGETDKNFTLSENLFRANEEMSTSIEPQGNGISKYAFNAIS